MPPQFVAAGGQPQPQQGQPVMINGQPYYPVAGGAPQGHPQPAPAVLAPGGAPAPFYPGNVGPIPPEVTGVGRTPQEEILRQVEFAYKNKLYEPQDFKPGDDDPGRFYYVRELDGNWTQRSRYTIDHMACRWYVTDEGWFYAVRLPE